MCYFSSIKVESRDIMQAFNRKFPDREMFKPVYSASAFTFPYMPVISTILGQNAGTGGKTASEYLECQE